MEDASRSADADPALAEVPGADLDQFGDAVGHESTQYGGAVSAAGVDREDVGIAAVGGFGRPLGEAEPGGEVDDGKRLPAGLGFADPPGRRAGVAPNQRLELMHRKDRADPAALNGEHLPGQAKGQVLTGLKAGMTGRLDRRMLHAGLIGEGGQTLSAAGSPSAVSFLAASAI